MDFKDSEAAIGRPAVCQAQVGGRKMQDGGAGESEPAPMTDAIQRLLERLQAGWRPLPQEIDREIPQRDLHDWSCVPGRRTRSMRLWGLIDDQLYCTEQSWLTDTVLWIDAGVGWPETIADA